MVKNKRKKGSLKVEVSRSGFLTSVSNTSGKKKSVRIYQGSKPGFSARFVKSGRPISGSSRNAEKLAIKLAKKGHKKVYL